MEDIFLTSLPEYGNFNNALRGDFLKINKGMWVFLFVVSFYEQRRLQNFCFLVFFKLEIVASDN